VGHLDDGALRRLVDDPYAVPQAARQHHARCAACQSRYLAVAADAGAAAALLEAEPASVDVPAALRRVRSRLEAPQTSAVPWRSIPGGVFGAIVPRRLATALLAGVLIVAVAAGSGLAETILQIFEPRQFVAVPLSASEMAALPDLSSYGEMSTSRPASSTVADERAAAAAAGMNVLVPSAVPAGIAQPARYSVTGAGSMTFTFRAERARQNAALHGAVVPAMPANIDGSKLYVRTHPVVEARYASAATGGASTSGDVPALVIVQTKAPTVSSTGVTVPELLDYLLAQPGISAQLAAQIRAIREPESTLPIPVPVDEAFSKPVRVQGVQALFIGDSTGVGSGVIWQKDGNVYAVTGSLTEAQVLAVANSLH
jgi:surface antigen